MGNYLLRACLYLSLVCSLISCAASGPAAHSDQAMPVTVYLPADPVKYDELINDGDFAAAAGLLFVAREISVPFEADVIRASADAAAKQMPCQAGPSLLYLKIMNQTAYVLLNIDRDGYAGVSYALARAHPVVEKTLLQFKTIDRVVWNEAPGDAPCYPE